MFPLQVTRPYLLARRFILAYTSTLLYKSILLLPFYSPSSIFSFLPNTAHPPYQILSPQFNLLALPLSYFIYLLVLAYIYKPLLLFSVSQTNSSVVPLRLSNSDFLYYILFMVIDKTALSIPATRVVITIRPFYSPTIRDLSHFRVQVFIIIKAFPPPIQVIP